MFPPTYTSVCEKCTNTECVDRSENECPAGRIFSSRSMQCEPCSQEFGAEVRECDGEGATVCEDEGKDLVVYKKDGAQYRGCEVCSDVVANC